MSIGADGAEYCVKYWSIGAGVSIEYRFHTNPAQKKHAHMQAASLVLVPRALFGALAFPRVRP